MKNDSMIQATAEALNLAEDALGKARAMFEQAGGKTKTSKASNDSKGSAGRLPSAEQVKIRADIVKGLKKGTFQYFTIAELTEALQADRIQTRNAVNYMEQKGAIMRYGEKLPDGRGQRELIYKAAPQETLNMVA